jgi:hypothetical protein
MYKVTLILPLNYNDGTPIPSSELGDIQRDILRIACGSTSHYASGRYTMSSGSIVTEPVVVYTVVVPSDCDVMGLHYVASKAARLFQQEAIYLDVVETQLTLVTG